MTDNFCIREGELADVPLLGPIQITSGGLFPEGRIPEPDGCLPESAFEASIKAGLVLVACVHTHAVGFALSEKVSNRLHLEQMSVLPEYGGRGIGRALVLEVIKLSSAHGLKGVTLTTFDDLPWNGPFYASVGFKAIVRRKLPSVLRSHIEREEELGMTNRIAMEYLNDA